MLEKILARFTKKRPKVLGGVTHVEVYDSHNDKWMLAQNTAIIEQIPPAEGHEEFFQGGASGGGGAEGDFTPPDPGNDGGGGSDGGDMGGGDSGKQKIIVQIFFIV